MGYLGRHATYAKTFSLKSLTKWGTAFTFVIYAISLSIAHDLSFRKDLKFIITCRSSKLLCFHGELFGDVIKFNQS